MQNIQLIKQLLGKIEVYNDFTRNNNVLEGTKFYQEKVKKYKQDICNLCRQIEGLHSEEEKGIL